MNTKILIKNVKMNEGSTKRGITAVITGVIVLYLTIKGAVFDYDQVYSVIFSKIDFWVGLGLNLIGFLGIFIPDGKPDAQISSPTNLKVSIPQDLPPIQLQARPTYEDSPTVDIPGLGSFVTADSSDQLRSTGQVQTGCGVVNEETASHAGQSGWNDS